MKRRKLKTSIAGLALSSVFGLFVSESSFGIEPYNPTTSAFAEKFVGAKEITNGSQVEAVANKPLSCTANVTVYPYSPDYKMYLQLGDNSDSEFTITDRMPSNGEFPYVIDSENGALSNARMIATDSGGHVKVVAKISADGSLVIRQSKQTQVEGYVECRAIKRPTAPSAQMKVSSVVEARYTNTVGGHEEAKRQAQEALNTRVSEMCLIRKNYENYTIISHKCESENTVQHTIVARCEGFVRCEI